MKRFYSCVLKPTLIILCFLLVISAPIFATNFTLEKLLEIAVIESTPISSIQKNIDNLKIDLNILTTIYQPKFSIISEPLKISPEVTHSVVTDQIEYDSNATLSASMKFKFGLQANTNVTLNNLLNDNRDYNYSFTLKYPILPGLKTDFTNIQIVNKTRDLLFAQQELDVKKSEVEIQVVKKFYSTLILQEKLNLSESSLKDASDDFNLYQTLFSKADTTQTELLQKEINYNTNLVSYERSKQQYQNSLIDLLSYVGIDENVLDTNIEIALEDSLEQLEKSEVFNMNELASVEELRTTVLSNSLILREAMLNLEKAKEELDRLKYNKGLSLDSQFDYRPVQNSKEEYNWALSINASYPLGDGGKNKLDMEKQQLQITDLESKIKDTEITILSQLEDKLINLKISYLNNQTAKLRLEKVNLDYKLKLEQFQQGMVSLSELDSNQRLVKNQELEYLQAKLDYQVVCWDLNQFVYLRSNLEY